MAPSSTPATTATPFRSSADRLSALLATALLLSAGAAQAAAVPTCPARIETAQSAVAPDGWTAERSASTKALSEIGFFDGPVANKVQLAPSGETGRGATRASVWSFTGTERELRLACLYRGTDIVLTRPLPAGLRRCTVAIDPRSPVVRPEALSCR